MSSDLKMKSHGASAAWDLHFMEAKCDTGTRRESQSWVLAWCHEGCFKPPCAELHTQLRECVKEFGGSLKCFRKAKQFAVWSAQATKPYVLFTDWREVKQCVAATSDPRPMNRAVSTIIHCLDDKQQRRVQLWVDNLTEPKDTVHIVQDATSLKLEVQRVLQRPFRLHDVLPVERAVHGDHGAHVRELQAASLFMSTEPAEDRVEEVHVSGQPLPRVGGFQQNDGEQAHCVFQQAMKKANGMQEPRFLQLEKVLPTLQFQSQWGTPRSAGPACGQATSAMVRLPFNVDPRMAEAWMPFQSLVVEQALLAAMPDHYED
mmetsp:Transcript_17233/g.33622  ORF Transcript_17233/g.33622 Transcript_17233/m.33622 type:complete len:317 (+) Transcript_17233:70-1020(+)